MTNFCDSGLSQGGRLGPGGFGGRSLGAEIYLALALHVWRGQLSAGKLLALGADHRGGSESAPGSGFAKPFGWVGWAGWFAIPKRMASSVDVEDCASDEARGWPALQ